MGESEAGAGGAKKEVVEQSSGSNREPSQLLGVFPRLNIFQIQKCVIESEVSFF